MVDVKRKLIATIMLEKHGDKFGFWVSDGTFVLKDAMLKALERAELGNVKVEFREKDNVLYIDLPEIEPYPFGTE